MAARDLLLNFQRATLEPSLASMQQFVHDIRLLIGSQCSRANADCQGCVPEFGF
jgi:hypothetical protein